jgi:hypothetical protein
MGRGVEKILSVALVLAVTLVAGVYFYDFLIRSIDSPSSLPIAYVNYADLVQDSDVAYFNNFNTECWKQANHKLRNLNNCRQ